MVDVEWIVILNECMMDAEWIANVEWIADAEWIANIETWMNS